ncbi:hypothetical protein [Coleofasciculus chthonoplastes]|uniref:hypothetical protein n=1 Tax=Coleofasciculus chthonoplastes TaxID=64178 RepID=UPI0032F3F51C
MTAIALRLLQLLLILLVYGGLLYQIWRNQKQLLKKCSSLNNGMKHCCVNYFKHDKSRLFPEFRKFGKAVVLEYGFNHSRCLIQDGKQIQETLKISNKKTKLTLFKPKSSLIKLPTLIRFISQNPEDESFSPSSHYFFATNAFGRPDSKKTEHLFAKIEPFFKTEGVKLVKQKVWIKILVYLCVIVAICGIIIAIDSGSRAALHHGPTLVATTNQGEVFTATSHYLYQFDAQGQIQNQYSLETLGIKDLTDLYALDQNQLLIADWELGNIQRCQLDQSRCTPLPSFKHNSPESPLFKGAFKFVVDAKNNLIYATDAGWHRLLVLDQEGRELESTRGKDLLLCYPNGITLSNDGKLVVADSNNLRILTWSTNRQGLNLIPDQSIDMIQSPRPEIRCTPQEEPRSEIPLVRLFQAQFERDMEYELKGDVIALEPARQGRVFPIFVQQDNQGFWWILVGDRNFNRDDLLRFDPDWQNPIRVNLPGSEDISHIAVGANQLILTQASRYRLFSVSLNDLTVKPFGDDRFEAMMQQEQQAESNLWQFYVFSLLAPLLGLVGLGVLALFDLQQQWADMIKS